MGRIYNGKKKWTENSSNCYGSSINWAKYTTSFCFRKLKKTEQVENSVNLELSEENSTDQSDESEENYADQYEAKEALEKINEESNDENVEPNEESEESNKVVNNTKSNNEEKVNIQDKSDNTTIDFKVMAISDLHANLMNYDYYTGSTTKNSGLVKAATVIKEEKEKANKSEKENVDNVILVDNGGTIQGTPLVNLYAVKQPVAPGEKYPVYKALESLGFDMTTIGNHEVNYGMDYIKQIVDANTSMGMVCANLKDAESGDLVFDPYKILNETVVYSNGQERELKIGITGVVPTQILNWDKVILNGKVTVDDMVKSVDKYAKEMKENGADIVVVLGHTGYGEETTDATGAENAG